MGAELPRFLNAVVVLLVGWGIKDSVDLSIKQRQLDLSYAKEMQGLLQAMGARHPEMDMSRVGVTGWSFGGYFSTMAVLLRPDVFKCAVAGAPVAPTRTVPAATSGPMFWFTTPQREPGVSPLSQASYPMPIPVWVPSSGRFASQFCPVAKSPPVRTGSLARQ